MHFGATLSQTAHLKLQMSCSRRSSQSFSFLPSSGNYFASHFFMGGEKFDTPHPEGYLFGENMDLNFLGNRPVQVRTDRQTLCRLGFCVLFFSIAYYAELQCLPCCSLHQFPYVTPAPHEPVKTLRSLVNIRKDSLRLVR